MRSGSGRVLEWLQDAASFTLEAAASPAPGSDTPPPEQDPLRRKLVEGVIYSRRLVLTYHFVILGLVTLLSSVHWTRKAIRWHRRRASRHLLVGNHGPHVYKEAGNAKSGPYSSKATSYYHNAGGISASSPGSSTTNAHRVISPRQDEYYPAVEDTPLIHDHRALQPLQLRRTLLSSITAFLMYQPPPIPILNKVLPPTSTSFAILAFLGLNIFYMLINSNLEIYQSYVIADRFGLLFVANLPYLYILAAKNQPLGYLTGRSYETLNLFHRRLGELLCLQALLHAAGMVCSWYLIIRPNGFGLVKFLLMRAIIYGLVAFFAYTLLYFLSLASFRRRWYELFLGLHVVLQALALVFVFLHHEAGRPYVSVALAIFLFDRLLFRVCLRSTTVDAYATIMEDDETVKLSTNIMVNREGYAYGLFGQPITAGWQATDHVFLSIPSLGYTHMLQSHPCTIISRAPTVKEGEARLELLIRARDGFSSDLLMRARSHRHLTVRLDGPYGNAHPRNILEDAGLALIVAGGSGIAVAWPLVHHLLDKFHSSDPETATTLQQRKQRIVLIWVIHKQDHMNWLGRKALIDVETRGAKVIIPQATEEMGRPNLADMTISAVDNLMASNNALSNDVASKKRVGVVVSGPDSMGRLVRNTCAKMVRDGMNVDVAVEKFGW